MRRRRPWPRALAGFAAALAIGGVAPAAAFGFGAITSWGGPGSGPGQFGEGSDVSVGPDFDVYVTDRFNNRVQVFSPLGVFRARFPTPESFGLKVVGGTVFVTDFSDAVQVFTTQGTFIRKFGSSGTRTDQGQPRFSEPWGIDVSPEGTVYIADSVNNRIVVTDQNGVFLGERGVGMLAGPFGVAAPGGGSIFVADRGNNRIIRLDEGGSFFPFGSTGSGNGQFNDPWDLAFDPNGDLLVVDRGNDRVQRLTTGGQFLAKFGGTGGGQGQLQAPEGLAVDAAGNVYVADAGNTRIVRFGDKADLSAAVTSLVPGRLKAGETATLTGRVANQGPDATRLATVRVNVPAGAAAVAATATQGGCTLGRPVTCAVGTIPAGAAVGVTVALRPTVAGTLATGVGIGGPTYDPDPTNNAAAASAAVNPGAVIAGPSLRVTFAKFHAKWRRSRSSGTLEVTVEHAARRPGAGGTASDGEAGAGLGPGAGTRRPGDAAPAAGREPAPRPVHGARAGGGHAARRPAARRDAPRAAARAARGGGLQRVHQPGRRRQGRDARHRADPRLHLRQFPDRRPTAQGRQPAGALVLERRLRTHRLQGGAPVRGFAVEPAPQLPRGAAGGPLPGGAALQGSWSRPPGCRWADLGEEEAPRRADRLPRLRVPPGARGLIETVNACRRGGWG